MSEYLIQDTSLVAIADEIRILSGVTSAMGLDAMTTTLKNIPKFAYTIVGGTTQPSSPSENTIWLNTSNTISSHVFSAIQPSSPSEGMVWIATGDSSDISFDCRSDSNVITICPLSAKQYVSGAWVDITAQSYIGGTWVDWYVWDGTLYDAGDEYEDITGGWVAVAYAGAAADYDITGYAPTVTRGTSSMTVTMSGTQKAGVVRTANLIDLSNYSTLSVTVISRAGGSSSGPYIYIIDANGNYPATLGISSTGTKTLSVSNLNGSYYVGIYVYNYTSSTSPSATFTNVKLS